MGKGLNISTFAVADMKGKKGQVDNLWIILGIWIFASLIITALIKMLSGGCVMVALAFVGSLFLVGAALFGIEGNLKFAGFSGVASAVFIAASFIPCFGV